MKVAFMLGDEVQFARFLAYAAEMFVSIDYEHIRN